MRLLVLFFLILPLYGVELVSYHIYDRNDRVDLMLSFDNTYKGKISQKKEENLILLTFSDLKYSKAELKDLKSELVDKISISSKNDNTYIMLQSKENTDLEVSSINDKFGIRIRVVKQGKVNADLNTAVTQNSNQELIPQAKSTSLQGYDYTNYILVISVLVVLLIVLWWFKKTLAYKNNGNFRDFNIIFQRFLDKSNQLVVFDYASKRYTMIIGNSNVLLESSEIPEDQILKHVKEKEKNFDTFFEENKKRIQTLTQKHQKNQNI
ncbi:hypothetical protein LNU06_01280 [Campylobacter sp. VicNov18]|uniref:hypothetical protein n=1 Tax=Campylobacter bilis TaxID=2691918 RepID=UPI00130DF930|nr:hypothetical protein [Campylobacter bilis]MPV63299.1 hypothetical protein [Campylobacter hepaticus]MBM0636798.1 hypothetical protein [Campylobacter bilis]MCC8277370.1 hypothetical protein [Campylobacter bilis]MCC8299113.1 hypothetical protein [Campylobacter bilis]MCC8300279.1 hypothetical protein [Campylobacter bilis]